VAGAVWPGECSSGAERTAARFDWPRTRELSALIREAVIAGGGTSYAHHSGHGIGVSVHENPRLVPGDETVLEPGMVIMVEPSSYATGVGGARSEWMFVVTELGNEVISSFDEVAEG
jgi:Xaa-Pro aminopeptidase